jgi:hypothetical protein
MHGPEEIGAVASHPGVERTMQRQMQVQTMVRGRATALLLVCGAGVARAQGIPDPSFEISGNAFQSGGTPIWQATSTNFDAPYCDSSCLGPGQSGAARTGTFWVWFGGTANYEAASVSQSIALPAGPLLFRFYLRAHSDRATSTDTLRVLVDSTVVFSITNQQILPYIADYAQVQIDLTPFAGTTRTIRMEAETMAGTGVTNFFVDDVSLSGGAPSCYPNCDASTATPFLNVQDFSCFLGKFSAGNSYANCDSSTVSPVLNVQDFTCFLQKFAAGCSAP